MTDSEKELVARLREHATDWNGQQMPNLEHAKADPTAGTMREAADAIEALVKENEQLAQDASQAQNLMEAAEAEVERLREALVGVVDFLGSEKWKDAYMALQHVVRHVHQALRLPTKELIERADRDEVGRG